MYDMSKRVDEKSSEELVNMLNKSQTLPRLNRMIRRADKMEILCNIDFDGATRVQ
jgi:hypothetical protein